MQPYFEQIGAGPDVVFLHGWGIHGGIFEHLYPELSAHCRITNIDLPGFGRSPLPNQTYSLSMVVDQLLSVMPENAIVLGWSLGGLIASHIALEHPQRVSALVTVGSSPRFIQDDDWPDAMKPAVMENFMTLLEEDYESTLIRFLAIQTMGSESQRDDIQRLKETVFIHGQPAVKALRGGLKILQETDLRAKLGEISQPTLRLYGRLDGLVPQKVAGKVAQVLPDSESFIFRKASHAPFLSHAAEFTERLLTFIKRHSED
ncbi:MAG: pimeloyl-ACP methyl ester esterase BioH [Gammaproteobacteria bacterium]|nr:pimeloyl-ACP methyl ester esterase BioH [Gammaproteobacteria bacterium]NVK87157.1 pimeloyl-ACP methyl ester esterase BioH [Gammaproteobacteria bacterium]